MRKWLALCLLLFLSVAAGCGFPRVTGETQRPSIA